MSKPGSRLSWGWRRPGERIVQTIFKQSEWKRNQNLRPRRKSHTLTRKVHSCPMLRLRYSRKSLVHIGYILHTFSWGKFYAAVRPGKSCKRCKRRLWTFCQNSPYFYDLSQIFCYFDWGWRKKSWRWRIEVGARRFEVGGEGHQDLRMLSCHTNIWYIYSCSSIHANHAILRDL